jgi:GNAT superfamily N-acetyltransferase
MPAHEHLSDIQFVTKHHMASETGLSFSQHRVSAVLPGREKPIGTMSWSKKGIHNVEVDPQYQRQGIATELWNRGHQEAASNRSVVAPKHSPDRTDAGDAWAKSVGGRRPRRS